MPQIPTFPGVQAQAIPGARLDPSVSGAAFSGNVNKSVDLSPAIQFAEKARNDADQVAVSAADAQLVQAKTKRLWDPHTGAMNARGKDAIPASDQANAEFQKDADEIENTLADGRQKEAFRRRVDMHYADLGNQLGQHVGNQIKQYDVDTTKAHVEALTDAAAKSYDDPNTVQQSIDGIRATLTDFGRRMGHAPEAVDQEIKDRVSAVRSSVFNQLSDTGQDLAAAAYLKEHRDEFSGRDLLRDEKIAEAGSTRAAGQQAAQSIVSKAATLSEAMAEVEKIAEPKVQDDAARRVRQHFADVAADITHQRQQAFQQGSKIIEQSGGDMDKVPLSIRTLLTPEENTALQHRSDQIRHPKDAGDEDAYLHQVAVSTLPSMRQTFLATNVLEIPGLNEQQRTKLMALQRQLSGKASGALNMTEIRRQDAVDTKLMKTDLERAGSAGLSSDELHAEEQRIHRFYAARQSARHGATTATDQSGDVNLAEPAKKPLPPEWKAKALIDTKYADHLRAFGYAVP